MLEESIKGDIALIKAWKGDKKGNLVYHKSARNFNQDMATAASNVVAEVEEIVDEIEPDQVHTPGIYVNAVVLQNKDSAFNKKVIEKITTQQGTEVLGSVGYNKATSTVDVAYKPAKTDDKGAEVRNKIAKRAAK